MITPMATLITCSFRQDHQLTHHRHPTRGDHSRFCGETASCRHSPWQARSAESGVALLIIVCLACTILLGFHFFNRSSSLQVSGNKQQDLAYQFSEMIFATLRDRMHRGSNTNMPHDAESCDLFGSRFTRTVLNFQNIPQNFRPLEFNVDTDERLAQCNPVFTRTVPRGSAPRSEQPQRRGFPEHLLRSYNITITPLTVSQRRNTKTINIDVNVRIKEMMGVPENRSGYDFSKSFYIRITSLERFGLIFSNAGRRANEVPISADKGIDIHVHSPILLGGGRNGGALSPHIGSPSSSVEITFHDKVISRAPAIDPGSRLNLKKFRQQYRGGIVTNFHSARADHMDKYLPSKRGGRGVWQLNLDLEIPQDKITKDVINATSDQFNTIITDKSKPENKSTCSSSETAGSPIFFQPGSDLELTPPTSVGLCAAMIAKELKITLSKGGVYVFIGIFSANNIEIQAEDNNIDATVHFINPIGRLSLPAEVLEGLNKAGVDVSLGELQRLFSEWSLKFLSNLYAPMIQRAPPTPRGIRELLSPPSPVHEKMEQLWKIKNELCQQSGSTLWWHNCADSLIYNIYDLNIQNTSPDPDPDSDASNLYQAAGRPENQPLYWVTEAL